MVIAFFSYCIFLLLKLSGAQFTQNILKAPVILLSHFCLLFCIFWFLHFYKEAAKNLLPFYIICILLRHFLFLHARLSKKEIYSLATLICLYVLFKFTFVLHEFFVLNCFTLSKRMLQVRFVFFFCTRWETRGCNNVLPPNFCFVNSLRQSSWKWDRNISLVTLLDDFPGKITLQVRWIRKVTLQDRWTKI